MFLVIGAGPLKWWMENKKHTNKEKNKKRITQNKRKTKGKSKTSKTNDTFAMKKVHSEKHEHRDTTWKNTTTQKKCHKTSKKKPCFPLFFGHPGGVGKFLRIIFWRRTKPKTKKKKNGPKKKNPKIGKRYFSPDFFMAPKGRVNKRSGGGAFFWYSSVEDESFDPLFWGSNFQGRIYANDIILQK